MKRTTAIRHLETMGAGASELGRAVGTPLRELWVAGDLLGLADTVETSTIRVVLDVPADELPWLALHPTGEAVGEHLRLGAAMLWSYRPLAWPVWNHAERRLVRFWSAEIGTDEAALEALRARRLDALTVVEPSAEELAAQLRLELQVSRRHLRTIVDRYWDGDWRRKHKGYGACIPNITCGARRRPCWTWRTHSTSSAPEPRPSHSANGDGRSMNRRSARIPNGSLTRRALL